MNAHRTRWSLGVVSVACCLLSFKCAGDEDLEAMLVGKWMLIEVAGSDGALECPDVIEISASGLYEVINDCYGPDARRPVVESGSWSIARGESARLKLESRSIAVNYAPLGSERLVTIIRVSRSELVVCIQRDRGAPCTNERFRKID